MSGVLQGMLGATLIVLPIVVKSSIDFWVKKKYEEEENRRQKLERLVELLCKDIEVWENEVYKHGLSTKDEVPMPNNSSLLEARVLISLFFPDLLSSFNTLDNSALDYKDFLAKHRLLYFKFLQKKISFENLEENFDSGYLEKYKDFKQKRDDLIKEIINYEKDIKNKPEKNLVKKIFTL